MSRIQVMPDTLASQVAAGEVVERPASVAKELIENSLDAGARHITVEIQRGGVLLLKVSDDGHGMTPEEAEMAFQRHATSKLKTSADLAAITQLGFRGEALPSIASVARVRMATRELQALSGTEVSWEGGRLLEVKEVGISPGTSFEVRELFFNVPARRKFLKAESTEAAHVEQQVRLHALAYPQVRFTFRRDGKTVYDLPGSADWRLRISGLMGQELARDLIEIPQQALGGIRISGYLMPAHQARPGRRHQFIFLNRRPIEDAILSRALREGFRGSLGEGMQAGAFLRLEMPAHAVDVNVHPAKREVRFLRPHEVAEAVRVAVESTLFPLAQVEMPPAPSAVAAPLPWLNAAAFQRPIERQNELPNWQTKEPSEESPHLQSALEHPITAAQTPPESAQRSEGTQATEESGEAKPAPVRLGWRYLASYGSRYYLFEGPEGLVMMDPAAAKERIAYERLLRSRQGSQVPSQALLTPELIELDPRDHDVVMRHREFFQEVGLQIEAFGGNTVRVESVPVLFEMGELKGFLHRVIDDLLEAMAGKRGKTLAFENFACGVAKQLSRDESFREEEWESLLEQLMACELPYCSATGRPTLVNLSMRELDRKFGR